MSTWHTTQVARRRLIACLLLAALLRLSWAAVGPRVQA